MKKRENIPEIMGINRLRMGTDGNGVSTLVTFYGCPLNCQYCLNSHCKKEDTKRSYIEPKHLVEILSVDDIYFCSTGGGVVFGGGEPLLQAKYIRNVCMITPENWNIRIETSLNVYWELIEMLIPYIDEWIIDIKDSNNEIYKNYTGVDGERVFENVCKLSTLVGKEKLVIRVPEIPNFNNDKDILASIDKYSEFGEIDLFKYRRLGKV